MVQAGRLTYGFPNEFVNAPWLSIGYSPGLYGLFVDLGHLDLNRHGFRSAPLVNRA